MFDLDWRASLWGDRAPEYRALAHIGARLADVVLGGDGEFEAAGLTPATTLALGARVAVAKHGPNGVSVFTRDGGEEHSPGLKVPVVNGLGAPAMHLEPRLARVCWPACRWSKPSDAATPPARSWPRGCRAARPCRAPTRWTRCSRGATIVDGCAGVSQVIHPSAPPNHLAPDELRVRPGADGVSLAIDPARAHWRHLSFRTVLLRAAERLAVGSAGSETAVVVLAGGGLIVEPASGPALTLEGRRSVFSGKPWAAYLPDGQPGHVSARPLDGGQVLLAIAEAPSSDQAGVSTSPILIRPEDVKVEVRGAGNATRRIHHIIAPDFPADRLEVVEVYTPAGNWSSWPPHKHDVDDMPNEAVLEEIYYYQQRRPKAGPCSGCIGAREARATASGPSGTASWCW